MNKSIIISGEASETDSEDESTHKIPTVKNVKPFTEQILKINQF